MQLHEIRERRAAKVTEARSLLASDKLTPEQQAAFDKLKGEITSLEADEARAQFLEDAERRSAGPLDKGTRELHGQVSLVEAIRCQVEGRAATGAVAEYSREVEQRTGTKGIYVPLSAFETRAQTTTSAANIVADDFRPDLFVGPLRNSLVMRRLGARVLTGLRGDVVIPRQKTSHTAQWLAEGDSLTESGMTFDQLTLKPRHVGALTELSRQLIQQASPQIEQLVRDDMSAVIAEAFDAAMINGDGVKEPLGLLNTVGIQTANLATLSWDAVQAMLLKLGIKNVSPTAWLTSPGAAMKLATTLKSTTAGAGYLLEGGTLAGLPVAVTNQVPGKGTSPVKGQIVLGDFSEMFVGVWDSVQILVNPYAEGPYKRGGVMVRALMTADVAVRRPEAFVVASDVAL
ncbi:phage major capsid protein [Pulveribacter suum]|uniref:Phage major capsid protein n=1 Tax=Pulveribacter suum TaxID=2116657 RepID=A0A2P1NJA1_9BURK|nr:phage major capsid protein [Pulveribacter suum]AVP57101.1 phage major capsid protein [Pulveribacter suum]